MREHHDMQGKIVKCPALPKPATVKKAPVRRLCNSLTKFVCIDAFKDFEVVTFPIGIRSNPTGCIIYNGLVGVTANLVRVEYLV